MSDRGESAPHLTVAASGEHNFQPGCIRFAVIRKGRPSWAETLGQGGGSHTNEPTVPVPELDTFQEALAVLPVEHAFDLDTVGLSDFVARMRQPRLKLPVICQ